MENHSGPNAENNGLWAAHSQWVHLYCISYISDSENVTEEGVERLKEPENHEVSCEILFPRNDWINKTIAMAISIDMLMWKAESHWVTPPEKEPWATDGEK